MPTPLKWTYEKCQEEALKYKSRSEFQKKSPCVYHAALMRKWLNDICCHMELLIKPSNHWTFENCYNEALKYKTRTEFNKKSNGAYSASCKNNWLDDVCKHMVILGSKYKRKIYVFEFPDNHAYVGLTLNADKRKQEHLNGTTKSAVFNYIKDTNQTPIYKLLTNEYVPVEEAKILEQFYIDEYKKFGWVLLNKQKAGGVGGNNIKWSIDLCHQEALKYKYRNDFLKNSKAYKIAQSNGWLDIICSHMGKKHNVLSKEFCLNESKKYVSRHEFQKHSKSAYEKSRINKWLDAFYPTI